MLYICTVSLLTQQLFPLMKALTPAQAKKLEAMEHKLYAMNHKMQQKKQEWLDYAEKIGILGNDGGTLRYITETKDFSHGYDFYDLVS